MPDSAAPDPTPVPPGGVPPLPAGGPAVPPGSDEARLPPGDRPPDDPRGAEPKRRGLRRRMRDNAREIWNEHKVLFVILFFFFLFLVAFFWNRIFIKVDAGEAGVLYRLFGGGTVTDQPPYGEGLHVIFPWNKMFIYNARVQQVADDFTVLSQDGLAIHVEVSIRYRPQYEFLGKLHKDVGYDYVDKVVKPEIQAQFRFVLGQYKPDEIYTSQGFIVQTVVQGALAEISERYILLDDLLLKSVTLPRPVAESIESKLRAQQLAQEFDYRLATETKEAQRKKIEAEGIRNFQDTITGSGISEQFLRFKGIEATLELAKSPNAKIVIIGGGDDRLPLILDGGSRSDSLTLPSAPTTPASRPAVSGPPRR
ncbi:MAG TPA: prohibitin family protein [Opitutaceae bacterium]|nr:prohibitin family protein [Opitutaceae bacterium]